MKRICAWCHPGVTGPDVSHTICSRHRQQLMARSEAEYGQPRRLLFSPAWLLVLVALTAWVAFEPRVEINRSHAALCVHWPTFRAVTVFWAPAWKATVTP